ncbi:NADP-dependent alcohol dehydrogenase [Parathielavia hyrcaniae]|uniref:NADP-dependent alcohol dehydrogenase n=1 Tax=Parathielavia hyrcaniae TaxID=113614 RepID=A0AAN6PS54_9PEZI|nr:NADP-dependent alcohol dehydrogenase [Parathielavia hyrcaniae]
MGYKFTVWRGQKDGRVTEDTTERPAHTGDQVYINVTHSGVSGTDLHFLSSGIALGHEGAGVVEAIGPEVKALKVGDRVGWGYAFDSCATCDKCLDGYPILCDKPIYYGITNQDSGSFATGAVRKESFVFRIPDGLPSEQAAPLMCGGISVFAPLMLCGVKPSNTVGVVGMGGLGHLAVQFARAMGCEVVVFSQTDSKREDALKLGASCFVTTKGKTDLTADVPSKIHHLLVTTNQLPDWDLFFPVLAKGSSIYPLTATEPGAQFALPHPQFLGNGTKVQSSMPSKKTFSDMLRFAARNNVRAVIECEPMSIEGINRVLDRLKDAKVRYRGVLCKH